jgi:hypothetical protein
MGTLDDAIREHLELKRRSGAPDEEVSRLEGEAFGPARREAPRPADAPPVQAPIEEAPEPVVADEMPPPPVAPPAEHAPEEAPFDPPVAEHDVPAAPAAPAAPRKSEDWMEDEPNFEPTPTSAPTSEFTAAEAREATGEPPSDYVAPDEEGEDLLEETPDFLQETPEHDRLWFEQKPPRDFDFDN